MTDNISIDQISLNDLDEYKAIRIEMVRDNPQAFDADQRVLLNKTDQEWVDELQSFITTPTKRRFIARTQSGELVGTASCSVKGGTLELGGLYVRPAHSSKGIGSKLFNECLDFGTDQKCTQASLWVSSVNHAVKQWYEKMGFKGTNPPTFTQWWDGSGITKEYMTKELYT